MDFLILLFVGLIIYNFVKYSKTASDKQDKILNCKPHKWIYNEHGYLQCSQCEKFPGEA